MADTGPDPNARPPCPASAGASGGVRRRFFPWVALVFVLAAVPLILTDLSRGRGQFDQQFFHEPTIRQFAAQWPQPDLSNYLSATTPGYHLAMAAVAHYVSGSLTALKLVSMMFTVALLWVLERAVWERCGRRALVASLLSLPVACSMYVFLPGVWLQPDNLGWLGVLVMLLIAVRPRWDELSLIAGALTLLLLVWVRQSHAWTAGLLWLAAWLGSADEPWRAITSPSVRRVGRVLGAMAASAPALACLAWFAAIWGGLTPPGPGDWFHKQHDAGPNAAAPAFVLSLVAVFSVFFVAWLWPGLVELWRTRRATLALSMLAAIALASAPITTYKYEERATGLWNIVRALDPHRLNGGRPFDAPWLEMVAAHTSPLIVALAALGALALACWLVRLPRRDAWVYGLGLAGFTLAQTANSNAWQRYFEPMLLMFMALIAATIGLPSVRARRFGWLGPAALALLGAAVTAVTLWREPVVVKTW